jgi:CRISPR system Cascade subunit CasD
MRCTLLLRFAAPLQSWGTSSKFDIRYTDNMPSKSGIIGFIAAALGIQRNQSLAIFNDIKVGVRVDQKGILTEDFQIARNARNPKKISTWVTHRHYLADAVFLVAVEGPEEKLKKFADAIRHPAFPLFLGRRSCPPSGQIVLGLRENSICNVLEHEPWVASSWYQKKMAKKGENVLEIAWDAAPDDRETYSLRDNPVSFDSKFRKYQLRNIAYRFVPIDQVIPSQNCSTNHDPMTLL